MRDDEIKREDEYRPSDSVLKKKVYEEFELSLVEEQNLNELEKNIKENKINSSNKADMLDYLTGLHTKLRKIKEAEYEYEGDANLNINTYLRRVENLINKINQIE